MSNPNVFRWMKGVSRTKRKGALTCTEIENYLACNSELRDVLHIDGDAHLHVRELGFGEHNEVFGFTHPATGKGYALRVNRSALYGVDSQADYAYRTVRALEGYSWVPKSYYLDRSGRYLPYDVWVVDECYGEALDYTNEEHIRAVATMLAELHTTPVNDNFSHLLREPEIIDDLLTRACASFERYRTSGLEEKRICTYLQRCIDRVANITAPQLTADQLNHVICAEMVQTQFLMGNDGIHYIDWDGPAIGQIERDLVDFIVPTTTLWDTEYVFTQEAAQRFFDYYWNAVGGQFSHEGFYEHLDDVVRACCLCGVCWYADAIVDYADPTYPFKTDITRQRIETVFSQEHMDMLHERVFRW